MTNYTILVTTDGSIPKTYQKGGEVQADSKEKAVEKFIDQTDLDQIENEFDFAGNGMMVDVVAFPSNYAQKFSLDYRTGNVGTR